MGDFSVESVSSTATDQEIQATTNCVIKVLGVGGGGGNSLQHMINQSLNGVQFIAVNTDAQALQRSTAHKKVQIGVKLTNGLGAGCDPNKGRKAAEESKEKLKELMQGSDMVFVTAGMGGGTGTGAAPVIAEIAKEIGALTVAVVTKPFTFEGRRHMQYAEQGIAELSKHVDSLIVIENDKLLKIGTNISIASAFGEVNNVLLNAVKGITDLITVAGFINVDFADVETIMRGRGHAMIGMGEGQGANFVEEAMQKAIHCPLIEQVDIASAAGLLVNVRVNPNFPITKWQEICDQIQSYADEEADCKIGMSYDDKLNEDQVQVTILITGIAAADDADLPETQFAPPGSSNNAQPVQPGGGFFSSQNAGPASFGGTPASQPGAPQMPKNMPQSPFFGGFAAPPAAEAPVEKPAESTAESSQPFAPARDDVQPRQEPARPKSGNLWDLPPILRGKAN